MMDKFQNMLLEADYRNSDKKICSSLWVVVGDKKESVANTEKMTLKWGAHETISGKRNTNLAIWKETFFLYAS